jgi:putative chitinase
MTPQTLAACTGARIDRARTHAPFITQAMDEYLIVSPERQAAFLAQIGHETGGLHWTEELWGIVATPQQTRYERDFEQPWPSSPQEAKLPQFERNRLAYALGNTERGDGVRFKGRGDIMVTGRFNYGKTGQALGVDLISRPEQLALPGLAARAGGLFWKTHGLNELADVGDFFTITRRVNGGTNGMAQRLALWASAKAALGVA